MIFQREIKSDIIKSKVEKIKDSLIFIEETLPDSAKKLTESRLIQNAVYKEVEFVIEQILDICSLINAGLRLGMPETEESVLNNLRIKKVFSETMIELITEMKRFRNILVHKYGDIDDARAYEDIKEGLKDLELIIKEVEEFLKKHKGRK